MIFRLNCEHLETRENPTGPALIDPIGIPVTVPPPPNVPSETAPTPMPPPAPTPSPTDAAIQQIIDNTIAAITSGW